MHILLAHALRTEAGLIKQHFPQATRLLAEHGYEMFLLKDGIKLFKTGMGLDRTEAAFNKYVDPENLDLIIHFGVSGSLAETLPAQTLIQGIGFKAVGKPTIRIKIPDLSAKLELPQLDFYSSIQAIADEPARVHAQATGTSAVDMESYAVAAFAQSWNIPLLSLRCISDRAGASTSEDFKQHFGKAAEILQHFILKQVLTFF